MSVTALVSDGGNHSPEQWAHATAQAILMLDPQMDVSRHARAQELFSSVENTLQTFYRVLINKEAENLVLFHDHADTPLNVVDYAQDALKIIQHLAQGTPWDNNLREAEWALAALETIASHFATAAHVERLIFADNHPDNAAAAAYKLKQG